MAQYKVFVAGKPFDCDAKVVTWHESGWDSSAERCVLEPGRCAGGVSAYSEKAINRRPNRFWYRPGLPHNKHPDLKAVQKIVRMFTIHHDGCPDARTCFKVLHDERGISCHFIIDNDGTIYQTLDLGLMGFQAAGFNPHSIGVELCNRGDAKKYPGYYEQGRQTRGRKRTTSTVKVHGHVYLAYDFNPEQVQALEELARCLRYALPNLPVDYPKDPKNPGQQAWGEIPNPKAFSGYMGHYHQTLRKWDPGPFDFKKFCDRVRGQACFPVTTKKLDAGRCEEIPKDSEELRASTDALYKLNDTAAGGFFPVGPWGDKRLWHGGVHLVKGKGDPVHAPFAGNIVAARMGPPSPVGSTNFVLMRHDMTVGTHSIRFWALYYHLADEKDAATPLEWMTSSKDWNPDKRGAVQLLNEPVTAGAHIGRVGTAGPGAASGAQLHFAIFSRDPFVGDLEMLGLETPGKWTQIDGTAGGRFCDTKEILDLIDKNRDGTITEREVADFFRGDSQRSAMHYFAVMFKSEWSGTADEWKLALKTAKDFADIDDRTLGRYIDDQITPNLWWTKDVAAHTGLSRDGVVIHYHPISFVKFVNEKMLETMAAEEGIGKYDVGEASATPEGVTDDREDLEGSSFFSEEDVAVADDSDQYPLERLVQGFDE